MIKRSDISEVKLFDEITRLDGVYKCLGCFTIGDKTFSAMFAKKEAGEFAEIFINYKNFDQYEIKPKDND